MGLDAALNAFCSTPTLRLWRELIDQIDALDEDDLSRELPLVKQSLSRTEPRMMRGQLGSNIGYMKPGVGYDPFGVGHEVRIAPMPWISAMSKGERSEKFTLITCIDMTYSSVNESNMINVLAHPDLDDLRELVLPPHVDLDEEILGALLTHSNTRSLERLRIGRWSKDVTEAIHTIAHDSAQLDVLSLAGLYSKRKRIGLETLHSVPFFSTISTLGLSHGCDSEKKLCVQAVKQGSWSSLTTLRFGAPLIYDREGFQAHIELVDVFKGQIETLELCGFHIGSNNHQVWETLTTVELKHPPKTLIIDELDASPNRSFTCEDIVSMLEQQLVNAPILAALEKLVLGTWATPELLVLLATLHPNLHVE